MKTAPVLEKNVNFLKKTLRGSDILYRAFSVAKKPAVLVFLDGLTDKTALSKEVIGPLTALRSFSGAETVKKTATALEWSKSSDLTGISGKILEGEAALFVEGFPEAYLFSCKKYPVRAVEESPTTVVVKGPREGFVEDLKTNLSLLRRRLHTGDLVIESRTVGKYSQNKVAVVYLSGVAEKKVADAVLKKIESVNVDGVPDSSYIAKYLSERPVSLIKQVGQTEKPDVFSAKILEGRVGIFVDGSPIALTVPYLLVEDLQNPEDYFNSVYRAVFSRLLRLGGLLISVLLPALYVTAQLYMLQLIPFKLLVTVVNSIRGIPLSPSLEMLAVLLIFEVLNEASVRMPKYVGMALSVVGALVLGDTAVRAGLVSTPAVLIMALSGICLYTVPDLADVTSVLRLASLIVAGTLGGYGLIISGAFLLVYLSDRESFGTPVLAPYAPRVKEDLKDGFVKTPFFTQEKRPRAIGSRNIRRLKTK